MDNQPGLTISQLARKAGVPTSSLRYYERVKLLCPEGRSQGNYRLYGVEALERLRFIRAMQATGFTLKDVAMLMGLRDGAGAVCHEVQALLEYRLADVHNRIEELAHVQAILSALLTACRASGAESCPALESPVDSLGPPAAHTDQVRQSWVGP